MLKDIKSTTKHSLVYALGNMATKVIGVVLIPIYTDVQYLTVAENGALAVLEATSQILVGLLTMAMLQSLTRWYWDKTLTVNQKGVFFTSFAFLLITITPFACIICFFAGFFSNLLFGTDNFSYLIILTTIASSVRILNNQVLCLAKLQSKSVLFSIVQIFKLTLMLGLILYGIIVKGAGLNAIWESTLISELVTFACLIPYIIKNSAIQFNSKILSAMLRYGIPLMLASVSGVALTVTDRYMLNSLSGLEETAVYSIGFRIANTLKIVVTTSLALSLAPLRMKKINSENNQRFYAKMATYSAYIFIIALLCISLFSYEVLEIFTRSDEYLKAHLVIPIIAYALFFGLLKDDAMLGLNIMKKTKSIGLMVFITSVLNIVLNMVLIKYWGIYGASCATLFSQLFFFVVMYSSAQRAYYIPYELKKYTTLIVISVVMIIVSFLITNYTLTARLLIKTLMFLSFPFLLYFFRFYEPIELERIQGAWKKWKRVPNWKKNLKP